jgi:alpha-galactosidase
MHVSLCGSLGIGGHLVRWGAEKRAEAAHWIAIYKEIRPIVQFGDLYRLRSPQEHAFSALEYVSPDQREAVLFAFRTPEALIPFPEPLPPLYLRGLNPSAQYTVEGCEGVRSGLAWMRTGLELNLGDYQSTVRRIRQVE